MHGNIKKDYKAGIFSLYRYLLRDSTNTFSNILKIWGLSTHSYNKILDDPFLKDDKLIEVISNQLSYAKTFTTLNLIVMLEK